MSVTCTLVRHLGGGRSRSPKEPLPKSRCELRSPVCSVTAFVRHGEKRHVAVKVDVAVHAAEQPFLGAPATAGAEHDQVVAAALQLIQELRAGVPAALDRVRDDV